jgi:hypothetical protein
MPSPLVCRIAFLSIGLLGAGSLPGWAPRRAGSRITGVAEPARALRPFEATPLSPYKCATLRQVAGGDAVGAYED